MPVTPTYPGVYIEEIPSGVRTIVGVATSVTAFVGRAKRGPTDDPITINSYGDYESNFGGLWQNSTMSYAVRDFYLNGGKKAIIVRIFGSIPQGEKEDDYAAKLNAKGLKLKAAYPGEWGNLLRMRVDYDGLDDLPAAESAKLFNLSIFDSETGQVERFMRLSIEETSYRYAMKVLADQSSIVRFVGFDDSTKRPDKHLSKGDPNFDRTKIWEDDNHSSKVADGDKGKAEPSINQASFTGNRKDKKGLFALEKVDIFNLLCIPPYKSGDDDIDSPLLDEAAAYCEEKRAFLIIDPPKKWTTKKKVLDNLPSLGTSSKNAAVFFPRYLAPDVKNNNTLTEFVPCGALAGVFARTDVERGVWKAPAGLEAVLKGVPQLSVPLTDPENGELNPLGVNCLRTMPGAGRVVWGARTLQGIDRLASEWKYIPIRRLALFIEESLYRGTQWVVFEPNDEPLWAQIRLNVGVFMNRLFRQGAFQGQTPREAYFVKCDKETTPQSDIDLGIVNIVVGFAPLKPAEFVIIKLQQIAGQLEV